MATDDFNRAGPTLGGNWTTQPVSPSAAFEILSSDFAAVDNNAEYTAMYYNPLTPGAAQFARVVLSTVDDLNDDIGIGPAVFMDTGADTSYRVYASADATREIELIERVAATDTVLDTDTTGATPAATDTIELSVNASGNLSGKHNGVERVAVTDTTITSGRVGFAGKAGNTRSAVTSWEGGDSYTLEQEGFRFRNDDGSETTATWREAQDINITVPVSTNNRLRILVNATGDAPTTQFRLDYKKSTDGSYKVVRTAQPALSRAEMTAGASSSNIQTHTTASITLTAGRLYLIGFVHSDAAPENAASSVATTGGAVTFTSVTSVVYDTIASNVHRLELWRAIPSSTVTDTIAINLGDAGTGCAWIIQEYTNPDTTTPLGTAVTNNANASTSIAVTPGALNRNVNHQIAFGAHDLNSTSDTASGTNWSSVGTGQTYATPNTGLECAENTSGTAQQVTFSGAGSADRAVIAVEVRTAPAEPILLSTSANITASGEATTALLTAPSGKSTSDFVAGRMQDDENPADTVDITTDDYSEFEFCLTAVSGTAVNGDIYQFRLTENGTAMTTYTLTPEWTIGTPYRRPAVQILTNRVRRQKAARREQAFIFYKAPRFQAGLLTPTEVTGVYSIATPTVVKGAVVILPSPVSGAYSLATPTLFNAKVLTPSAVTGTYSISTGSVLVGGRTLTPSAVVGVYTVGTPFVQSGAAPARRAPILILGGKNRRNVFDRRRQSIITAVAYQSAPASATLTPTAVTAVFTLAAANVIEGAIVKTPSPVVYTASIAGPTILMGGQMVSPSAIVAALSTVAPNVLEGPVVLVPTATVGVYSVLVPVVVGGEFGGSDEGGDLVAYVKIGQISLIT